TEARHLQWFAAPSRREVQHRSEKGRGADVADRRAGEGRRSEVAGGGELSGTAARIVDSRRSFGACGRIGGLKLPFALSVDAKRRSRRATICASTPRPSAATLSANDYLSGSSRDTTDARKCEAMIPKFVRRK